MERITRRQAMYMAGAMGLSSLIGQTAWAKVKPDLACYPFTLGVASGDPLPDSVVLWTRLAPGGLSLYMAAGAAIEVRWQVAADPAFRRIVREGISYAEPEWAHSVHVEVDGLAPATDYFYRFQANGFTSLVGRTRTAPALLSMPESLSFAQVCCQSYSAGYYSAYREIAERKFDFVLHLGDYIYESDYIQAVRRIPVPEARTLEEYRALYTQYRLDPHLQAAHASAPWLIIWDDHEVDNDYGGFTLREPGITPEASRARRAAAYQAFYEHQPLRHRARPRNDSLQLYQRSNFGRLLALDLLDFRQYRNLNTGYLGLGRAQEEWFLRGFGQTGTLWNVFAQPTVFAPFDLAPGPEHKFDMDGWDAFPATRQRMLDMIVGRGVTNPMSLGGNIHANYAGTIPSDALDSSSPPAASELVATSITSLGGGEDRYRRTLAQFAENPFATYFDNRQRGYIANTVTAEGWTADFRAVNNVFDPASHLFSQHLLTIQPGQVGFS